MQLLVRVVDKTSPDPVKNIQLTKRGDVIAVKKDGEAWGLAELTNPEWRIVNVPDMSEAEAIGLLAPEAPPLGKPDQPVMKRAFRLNLDTLASQGVKVDDQRKTTDVATADQKLTEITLGAKLDLTDVATVRDTVVAVREQKPASKDPVVIGADDTVIGPT